MTISTLVRSRSLESLTHSQHMLPSQLDIISTPGRRLDDIETDRAPVGRQWAIKRARKMSPEN
ncbi:hypothetical protein T12_10330 [Trichinella patagoniensis]|uniref:Uncharacterized protein n=1 Tax=Trichinella patagoniensis TaxID=990121 RepID=A0A0V0ZWQ8_9BILA|nr:hypothetical protein T12_10330 [Trichinella patagoniensis]